MVSDGRRAGRRVLVVEDDPDSRLALTELLKTWGHDVQDVGDGQAALEVAAVFRPDVAILDLRVPGMDGCVLATTLRKRPDPPVLIAYTGSGQPADRERAARAGFDAFVVKPGTIDDLRDLVAAAVPGGRRTVNGETS